MRRHWRILNLGWTASVIRFRISLSAAREQTVRDRTGSKELQWFRPKVMVAEETEPRLEYMWWETGCRGCEKRWSKIASAFLSRATHRVLAPQVRAAGCVSGAERESQNQSVWTCYLWNVIKASGRDQVGWMHELPTPPKNTPPKTLFSRGSARLYAPPKGVNQERGKYGIQETWNLTPERFPRLTDSKGTPEATTGLKKRVWITADLEVLRGTSSRWVKR